MSGVIPAYLGGQLMPVPQSDEGLTYAAKIEPGDRQIRIQGTMGEEINRVRGLSPEPAATLVIDGEPHQVLQARAHAATPEIGSWVDIDGVPVTGLSDGGIELVMLLPPGRAPMSGAAWLRGRRRPIGVRDLRDAEAGT